MKHPVALFLFSTAIYASESLSGEPVQMQKCLNADGATTMQNFPCEPLSTKSRRPVAANTRATPERRPRNEEEQLRGVCRGIYEDSDAMLDKLERSLPACLSG